jgi:hypothetical protein
MDRETTINKCRLIPLKTTLEVGARESVINVYVVTIPLRQASSALR